MVPKHAKHHKQSITSKTCNSSFNLSGHIKNSDYINCNAFFQALFTLFVFATKDGWVSLMYDGIDAVGIDKQVSIHTFVNFCAFNYF